MNFFQDSLHEIRIQIHCYPGLGAILQNLSVARCLQYRHTMFFLIYSNLPGDTHPFGQQFEQILVDPVDLSAQFVQVFGRLV